MATKAKVFISCGQRTSEERQLAGDVGAMLAQLGYDPYIAIRAHSLTDLKDITLAELSRSDYYLMIDFKREGLDGAPGVYRGSLFTHQELAVAAHLELSPLIFQEDGVKERDGILSVLGANPLKVSNRAQLVALIKETIGNEPGWNPNWTNGLFLRRLTSEYVDVVFGEVKIPGRFFHIDVNNLHKSKLALGCFAYLVRVVNLGTGQALDIPNIELKWAGYLHPSVVIPPDTTRQFDAFWIPKQTPVQIHFYIPWCDSTQFIPTQLKGPGDYELTYSVRSETFREATAAFRLHVGATIEDSDFSESQRP
jgi:hypothetical protein